MDKNYRQHSQNIRLLSWRKAFGTTNPSSLPFAGMKTIDRTLIEYLMLRLHNGQDPTLLISAQVDPGHGHISVSLAIPDDEPKAKPSTLERFMQ